MKNIALVAHDNKKEDCMEWCDYNKGTLSKYNLYATGGTGIKIAEKRLWRLSCLRIARRAETWRLEL
jgi:methylglyoxal synthase